MATLREIRRRIGGVKSTQKITKAMKMVAAAKLRRAQDAIISARPYARKMKELLQHLAGAVENTNNPLLVSRPVERAVLVVVTSDRGLCGAFNANIIKAAINHIKANYAEMYKAGNLKLECVGKKGYDTLIKRDYKIISKHLGIFGTLNFGHARAITEELVRGYIAGEYDKVEIIYNEFKSVMQQNIVVEQLIPIPSESSQPETSAYAKNASADRSNLKPETLNIKPSTDYIYEPSSLEIIKALVPKHLNFQMWRILLESNAAEQGARMTAMENATTNAQDLIRVMTLSYNKARQAAITKELLEIVSGAEALKKAG
jgi:F-type H+-transporting ATPase subunit gamma